MTSSPTNQADLRGRYEAEVTRLEGLVHEHERDRRRVRLFLWGVALALPLYFVHPLAALGAAFIAVSLYLSGLYLSSMHFWDRKEQLRRAKRELARLQRETEPD